MTTYIEKIMIRERAGKLPVVTEEMYKKCNYETREIVEEFFAAKSQLSKDTRVQYRSALNQFVYWLYENAMDKPLYKVKKRDFVRFMSYLVNRGMSSSGLKFKKSAVSSLCKYIEDNIVDVLKMVEESDVSNVPVVDKEGRLAGLLTSSSLVSTMSKQFISGDQISGDAANKGVR